MNITHRLQEKTDDHPQAIFIKTQMPKDYIKRDTEELRANNIMKVYFQSIGVKRTIGVRRFEKDETMVFFVNDENWGSQNHIHLLTVVRNLIMADVRKVMGNEWINPNFDDPEDDETRPK